MGRRVRWDKVAPVDSSARGTPTSVYRIPLNENDVVVPCARSGFNRAVFVRGQRLAGLERLLVKQCSVVMI